MSKVLRALQLALVTKSPSSHYGILHHAAGSSDGAMQPCRMVIGSLKVDLSTMESISPSHGNIYFLVYLIDPAMRRLLRVLTPVLLTSHIVHALNNTAITEAFPRLVHDFPNIATTPPELRSSHSFGRQDFEKCCSLAVYQSVVQDDNGSLGLATPSFIGSDLDQFRAQQYPCGATYTGSKAGAPHVTVTYGWCSSKCPGWQRSRNDKLNQWVLPVSGFIVPAVAFCLAIPRRRKLVVWEGLFDVPLQAVTSAPRTPFIAAVAMTLVSVDTIVWLMVVFALAGPILVSGVYEASIDNRILTYLQEKIRNKRLSVSQRCQLMYIILVGNLDMLAYPRGSDEHDSPWNHISGPGGLLAGLDVNEHRLIDIDYIESTKTRLRTMLDNQSEFGITVGAPVLFFCGGFLYTFIDNYSRLGDNSTSHALGMIHDCSLSAEY